MATLTMNEIFYERYIKNNFYLSIISYDENGLYIEQNGKITKRVDFNGADDLAKLPMACFTNIREAETLLDVLSINNKCEKDLNDSDVYENMTLSKRIERLFLPLRFIFMKNESTEEEDQKVIDLIIEFNDLVNGNGYLTETSQITFEQLSSLLNWTLKLDNPNNNAELIVKQYIWSLNNGQNNEYIDSINPNKGGKQKGSSRVRNNDNAPSVINETLKMDNAGFFSFMALLYVALNLLVCLVVFAIKK